MQKGVILGCGNRSNAGMDTVAKLTWSTKLQLQNLVPTWALGTKLVPKAHGHQVLQL
jgi:hypothetical protein